MEKVPVRRWKGGREAAEWDVVAEESALEIRVSASFKAQRFIRTLAVTMRTPGHDEDLAAGLLFSEGILKSQDEVTLISRGGDGSLTVDMAPWADVDWTAFDRNLPISSSCGICGRKELPRSAGAEADVITRVKVKTLCSLPDKLAELQEGYAQTGGLHAAALFDVNGEMLRLREDVGRHNALDKLIGSFLAQNKLPLRETVLLMTSRASYDILQKAALAGIPFVAAVGAPSTAAIALAEKHQITLVGFLRDDRFNVYTGSWRISG